MKNKIWLIYYEAYHWKDEFVADWELQIDHFTTKEEAEEAIKKMKRDPNCRKVSKYIYKRV